jgi:hypothetical protein
MNNWWKAGLLGLGGAGLLAASGGTLAAPFAGILGDGAAAAGTGATAVGEGAAATGATAGTAAGAGSSAATAFVTPPVIGGGAPLSGALAGTDLGYGSAASNSLLAGPASSTPLLPSETESLAALHPPMVGAATPPPGLLAQAGHYAGMAGKAATAYSGVNNAMMANQHPMMAPPPRPVFQGDSQPISQPMQGMLAPPQNAFAQQLLAQRQRGILS